MGSSENSCGKALDGLGSDRDLIAQGEARCRKIALDHYENFAIAGWLLPAAHRQDLYNIYAFCRLADDFADETHDKTEAQANLERWERQLKAAVCGVESDPLFLAVGGTIRRRELSLSLFLDLLSAFKQDLVKTRYANWEELRDYTRRSADPVGRLVLELFGYRNIDFFAQSDNICTALQLANHWQDIFEDYQRGRIYIPLEDMQRYGVTERMIKERDFTPEFKNLIVFEVERALRLFEEGKPLIDKINVRMLRVQLQLYYGGGIAALDSIKRIGYDVLNHTAKVRKVDKMKIGLGALTRLF